MLILKKIVSVTTNPECTMELDHPTIDLVATGKNLKRLRLQANLTQGDVAGRFYGNISPAAISAWETGKTMPDYNHLVALGCIYGDYTFDDLIILNYPKEAS